MADKKQTGGQNISSGRDHQPDEKTSQGPKGSSKVYSDQGSQGTGGGSGRSKADNDPADPAGESGSRKSK